MCSNEFEMLANDQYHNPEPALKKAMSVLEFLSQDEQARQRYIDRQKFLWDEASMIEGAREEGFKN